MNVITVLHLAPPPPPFPLALFSNLIQRREKKRRREGARVPTKGDKWASKREREGEEKKKEEEDVGAAPILGISGGLVWEPGMFCIDPSAAIGGHSN